MPFGLVAVQQPVRGPAVDLGGQFPAEVERVLDAEVEALPADRRVDVRRVAGQQHPAGPVALGQPGGVAEAGDPARGVHAEVGAGERPQPLLELVQGRRDRAVLGHPRRRARRSGRPRPRAGAAPNRSWVLRISATTAASVSGDAATSTSASSPRPGGLAGEADAEQLAHRAAAAVAADEVARAQPRAVGQLGGHPVVVLAQPDQFAAAPDLGAELGGVLGQQALGDGLRDAEDVGMRGVQPVRRRLGDAGEEAADRVLLAEREEPLQQTALVHHLDAARVQAEPADDPGRLRLLLQHEHVHAVQPQLAGQHHAGRSAAGNDHVNHENSVAWGWRSLSCVGGTVRTTARFHPGGLSKDPEGTEPAA